MNFTLNALIKRLVITHVFNGLRIGNFDHILEEQKKKNGNLLVIPPELQTSLRFQISTLNIEELTLFSTMV